MRSQADFRLSRLLLGASVSTAALFSLTAPAFAETAYSFKVPASQMSVAIEQIASQAHVVINYDPDAVANKMSRPVSGHLSVEAALSRAIGKAPLAFVKEANGSWTVINSVVVIAHRDEAEASVVAHSSSTSDRLGMSIKEQPRNTEVITAKLMQDQQAQSVADALRNSGSVMVNSTMVQSGTTYSVRGYSTQGIQNGLPSPGGIAAGSTQSVDDIERIEVLSGPDAILAGTDNMGGTVNIVMKKPSADPLLSLKLGAGSYGDKQIALDANHAVTSDGRVSARLILSADNSDRNFAGYQGTQQYTYAPSIRYKDENTDALFSFTSNKNVQGASPYTMMIPGSNTDVFKIGRDKPLFSKDQGVEVKSTQYYGEITHKFSDWMTWITRAQHEDVTLDIRMYAPFAAFDAAGDTLVMNEHLLQQGKTDSIDSYLRFSKKIGILDNKLSVGETYYKYYALYSSNSNGTFGVYNLYAPSGLPPIGPADTLNNALWSTQRGVYAQYLGGIGNFHFLAGMRYNTYTSNSVIYGGKGSATESKTFTPNYGMVYDLTKAVSLFATYTHGITPNFATDYQFHTLPDIMTQNGEYGVKAGLMQNKLFLTASMFRIRQSNTDVADPKHVGHYLPGPGMLANGVDASISGQLLPGWDVTASVVSQNPHYIVNRGYGDHVTGQAKLKYNLYSSYRHKLTSDMAGGVGLGVYGVSKMPIDMKGQAYVPASLQVDMNGFLEIKNWNVNLGVRNIFDRVNYGSSSVASYIPYLEPRNVHLTVSYRFF